YNEIYTLTKIEIKNKVKKWDTQKWREELEKRTSTHIYRIFKTEIKEEQCYDNRLESIILFQARANTLELNKRKRYKQEDPKCELCGYKEENLIHFLIECKELEESRNKELIKKFKDENKELMAGKILFEKDEIEEIKCMLGKMWRYRKRKLEKINRNI
ncbi:unnamed protein product, partial [Meganyctiphanes norvegica]